MAAIAVGAVGSALTSGLSGASLVAASVAVAGATVLASYIDQQYVYPALFGKKRTAPQELEGFQISTTDPGAPRWEVYGTRSWVPCHYLWSLNVRDEITGGGGGKGGPARPFTHTVRADVGLAVADGPLNQIESVSADERPFWVREFNLAVIEDYRWEAEPGSGPTAGMLVVTCETVDQQDFASLLIANDLVRLVRFSPVGSNGFYRVVSVTPHSGDNPSSVVLQPLEGQAVVSAISGSSIDPAEVRRIDYGTEFAFDFNTYIGGQFFYCRILAGGTTLELWAVRGDPQVSPVGEDPNDEVYLESRWPAGGRYRLRNFTQAGEGEGVWVLREYTRRYVKTIGPYPHWIFDLEPGGNPVTASGVNFTVTNPLIITRDGADRFVFYDDEQDYVEYPGTRDQDQDPFLAASEPDAPAHRGIAHLSIANWNLGPHGNIFPRVTSMVRSRRVELVAETIRRICTRVAPGDRVDVSGMRERPMLGFSMPGGMASIQGLQPLLVFYGLAMQDRGGVMTFLDERDLPVVTVATRHLNARPSNERTTAKGFVANRVEPTDLPERVLVRYIDPSTGKNEAEGVGRRTPGDPDRGARDTLEIDLRPLVAWGYDVKRRARELDRRIRLETYRGQVALPPGYMDVLPGTILTFASNNDQEEDLPAGATIAYDTELRDIVPGSVALQVRFTNGQVATLLDDENGALEGLPAGITASVNAIDYEAGRIDLTCSVDLDDTLVPALTYRYEKQWFMRASKALLSGFDFSLQCDVVTTSTDDPLPPLPREIPGGLGGALAGATPVYETEVIDVPPLYVGQNSNVLIYFGITPTPGSVWRGATIYQSPNGTDRWSAVSQAGSPTPMGTVPVATLPDSASANPAVIDWTTEVTVDLASGETLESATTEQIALGQNWALIGDEIVGFHEAEAQAGTEWVLRGLVRALRHTHAAIDTHADGERFVLLTGIGGLHGAVFEPVGGYAAANRTYYFRVVPAGASVDSVETISQLIVGRSALVAPPLLEASMITQSVGSHLDITWERRSYGQTTLFGALPLPPGEFERYEVVAFDHAEYLAEVGDIGIDAAIGAAARRRWIVGDQSMGTPLVDRAVVYTNAEMEGPDGFVLGTDAIGFVVYQMGAAGRSERSGIVVMTPTATPVEV